MRPAWRSERPYFSRMPRTAGRRRSGLNYVSRRDVLEPLLLQREVRYKAAQPSVLALQLLQALGLLDGDPAVLSTPALIALLADPGLLAGERQAFALRYQHLDLAQHHNDLLGAHLVRRQMI